MREFVLVVSLLMLSACHAWAGTLVSQGLGAGAYTASSTYDNYTPDQAFNGITDDNGWNAAAYSGWIQVDLQHSYELSEIKLFIAQSPNGNSDHLIYVSNSPIGSSLSQATLLTEFAGSTYMNQIIDYVLPTPISARYVEIDSVASVSWIDWREVQVFASAASVPEPSTFCVAMIGAILSSIVYRSKKLVK